MNQKIGHKKRLVLFFSGLLLTIFGTNLLYAQLNPVIVGDAIDQGNNCYTITQDILNQAGAVWYDNPIDFDEDFTILYQNNFGFKDVNGADGMALVFKSTATPELGNAGGGLGYQGIAPSLVVEFDTYQNNIPAEGLLADPLFDHIAILANGNPFHNNPATNLAGPVQASPFSQNIEDGNTHEIKIEWIASTTTLNVFFDCELRLTSTLDIKTTIFFNDDTIFFGFVGSTGGLSNVHELCFNSISFVDNLQLPDDFICEGSSKDVDATIPSGVSYTWSPTDGVSDPNSPNPTLSPSITTTYTVTIADVCGNITEEEFTLSVLPIIDPIFDAVDAICEGDPLNPLSTTSNNGITGTWLPALNNTQTTTYTFMPNSGQCALEVDLTIEIIPNEIPVFDSYEPICPGEFIDELPTTSNNSFMGTWSPEINNFETTTYTFTPDAGQGCVAQTTLEIIVTEPIIPQFDVVNSVCQGETIPDLPNVSIDGITGIWTPELNNSETTIYTFTPNPNQCAIATELTIEIIPISELVLEVEVVSEPFAQNQTVMATVSGGTGDYLYRLDDGPWVEQNVFTNVTGCEEHIISVREASGCSNVATEQFRILEYPKYFTPNGDAFNPFWNIECLNDQPRAKISIFDRYGKLLKVIATQGSGWDGTYNGNLMPTNDYWFKVEYFSDDGSPRIFAAHFTLRR